MPKNNFSAVVRAQRPDTHLLIRADAVIVLLIANIVIALTVPGAAFLSFFFGAFAFAFALSAWGRWRRPYRDALENAARSLATKYCVSSAVLEDCRPEVVAVCEASFKGRH